MRFRTQSYPTTQAAACHWYYHQFSAGASSRRRPDKSAANTLLSTPAKRGFVLGGASSMNGPLNAPPKTGARSPEEQAAQTIIVAWVTMSGSIPDLQLTQVETQRAPGWPEAAVVPVALGLGALAVARRRRRSAM